jgi:hypothetical protein
MNEQKVLRDESVVQFQKNVRSIFISRHCIVSFLNVGGVAVSVKEIAH